MTLFTEMTLIYDHKKTVDDILKLFGCKMFTRKLHEQKWTHECLPTQGSACGTGSLGSRGSGPGNVRQGLGPGLKFKLSGIRDRD